MGVEGKIKAKKPSTCENDEVQTVTYRVTGMAFDTVVHLTGIFTITFNVGIKAVPWNHT